MEQEPKSSIAKSEKKIHGFLTAFFAWFDRVIIHPAANWLNNWQNGVSVQTRNFWIVLVLGLFFLGGLYNLIVFISTFIN